MPELTDRQHIERIGVKRVVQILREMDAIQSVWGEDANGTLFLGWIGKDLPKDDEEDRRG